MLNELLRNDWNESEDHDNCVWAVFRGSKLEVTAFPCEEDSNRGCVLIEVSNHSGDYQSANLGTTSDGYPSLLIEQPTVIGDFLTFTFSAIMNGVKEHDPVTFNQSVAKKILESMKMFEREVE